MDYLDFGRRGYHVCACQEWVREPIMGVIIGLVIGAMIMALVGIFAIAGVVTSFETVSKK